MKYKDWVREWLEYKRKSTISQRTYEKYIRQVQRHILPVLGEYGLEKMSAVVLQRFVTSLTDKGLSSNTVNSIISLLKSSLKTAVLFGVADKQYTDNIIRPKHTEKQVECFSLTEQRKIEQYILGKKSTKLFGVVICLYTGLRIGELLALTWKDIDFQKGIMTVSKSCHDSWKNGEYIKILDEPKTVNSRRIIPILKQLLPYLKNLHSSARSEYVVYAKDRTVQVRSYQKTFELLLNRLELPHRGFHSLRHTFATRALECGMDVKTLSEILGHKNPTVTLNRYVHSMLEYKTEMMNRLGKILN